MSDAPALEQRTDDFSRTKVPDRAAVSGGRIVLTLMSAGIALPILMLGAELGVKMGAWETVVVAVVGGVFLALIASQTSACGADRRMTTYALIVEVYGRHGGKLVNLILAGSVWGWVGVNATMFGQTLAAALPASMQVVPVAVWTILGAVTTTIIAVVGFSAMNWLATIIVPIKAGLLLWTVAAALDAYLESTSPGSAVLIDPTMMLGTGVSAMIGAFIIGAIMQPDLCRFARTTRAARTAGVFVYGFGFPAIVILAGLSAAWVGDPDILGVMTRLGLGLAALLIVMLAAISTNTVNLYSGSLLLATIFTARSRWLLAAIGATLGTILGLLGITEFLIPWFVLMGSYVPAFAGVYIANYLLRNRFPHAMRTGSSEAWQWDAFAAAALGVICAFATARFLPSVPAGPAVAALFSSVAAFLGIRVGSCRSRITPPCIR